MSEVEDPSGSEVVDPAQTDDLLPGRQGARVVRGQIGTSDPQLYASDGEAFMAALTSGFAEVERYRRIWRLGRVHRWALANGDEMVFGRLGYQASDTETSVWSEEDRDWRQQPIPRGETVAFAVRLHDLRIAFQIRPPVVTVAAFTNAMEAMLNRQEPNRPWFIELGTSRPSYRAWRASVTRVIRARGRLETPNPHWIGREKLEAFFDDFHLDEANVNLRFDPEAPREAVDEVVSQMVEHAERGYGTAVVVGQRGQNDERAEYRTEVEQTPAFVPSDEHGEATQDGLVELLEAEGDGHAGDPASPTTG